MAQSITCRNVSKKFGKVQALHQADLEIAAGQRFALLGPSGCGKSTLLRLIAGLEDADDGQILFDTEDVTKRPTEKRRVGMVFQDYALFPHMTVAQNIRFAELKRSPSQTASWLERVRMTDRADHLPHQLSGGQQQRVALARALASRPNFLLLDEPFSNLDAHLRTHLRHELRSLVVEEGITSLFVTHDQEDALNFADRIGLMSEGRILQCGAPRTLYEAPDTRQIANFLGEGNFFTATGTGSTAQTPIGTLPLRQPHQGPMTVMLRPEWIHTDAEGDTCGTVISHDYYGHREQIQVHCEALSAPLLITQSTGQACFKKGDEVRFTVVTPAHGLHH